MKMTRLDSTADDSENSDTLKGFGYTAELDAILNETEILHILALDGELPQLPSLDAGEEGSDGARALDVDQAKSPILSWESDEVRNKTNIDVKYGEYTLHDLLEFVSITCPFLKRLSFKLPLIVTQAEEQRKPRQWLPNLDTIEMSFKSNAIYTSLSLMAILSLMSMFALNLKRLVISGEDITSLDVCVDESVCRFGSLQVISLDHLTGALDLQSLLNLLALAAPEVKALSISECSVRIPDSYEKPRLELTSTSTLHINPLNAVPISSIGHVINGYFPNISKGIIKNIEIDDKGNIYLAEELKLVRENGHEEVMLKLVTNQTGELTDIMRPLSEIFHEISHLEVLNSKRVEEKDEKELIHALVRFLPNLKAININAKLIKEPDDVCTKMVDKFGDQLFLEAYDITLSIPPGAIVEEVPVRITLRVLTDTTSFSIRDEDSAASFGFECTSSMPRSKLRFGAPVTITLPHCAVIDDDSPAEAGIYYGDIFTDEIKSIERIQFSTDSLPRCEVKAGFIITHVDHFSCGLPFFRGLRRKKLGCCPFLPELMPELRTPILRVYVYHHVKGNKARIEGIVSLESQYAFHQVHPGVIFIKERNTSDVTVSYVMGDSHGTEEISYMCIREEGKDCVDFVLDFTSRGNGTVKVTLKQQRTDKMFLFNTDFPTSNALQSASSSAEPAVGTSATSSQNSIGASYTGEDPVSDQVSEEELHKLSRNVPHDRYHEFAYRLARIEYPGADSILSTKGKDYTMATRKVLADWKTETGGSRAALRTALKETGMAHVATQCLNQ